MILTLASWMTLDSCPALLHFRKRLYVMQFGFDTSSQDPNVLIGFGLSTAVVVSMASTLLPSVSLLASYSALAPGQCAADTFYKP